MSRDKKEFKYKRGSGGQNAGGVAKGAGVGRKAGGRIRVQAGDKGVSPAKSKPKKRKAVGPQDESTLSMDSILWDDKSYSVRALKRNYAKSFPLIVKVTHGYLGQLGQELRKGEVLQVHSAGEEARVLATDSAGRELSVPLDFPLEVMVLNSSDRVWMRLRDVVLTRRLPATVRIVKTDNPLPNVVGEDWTITSTTDVTFLRANHIINGWIDQVNVTLLPGFLECELSPALGMRGASEEEWTDYQGMYRRSVRHLNFSLLQGYGDIYVNCDDPYPLHDTVKRDTGSTQQRTPDNSCPATLSSTPYTQTPPTSPHPYTMKSLNDETAAGNVYENLPNSSSTAEKPLPGKTSIKTYDNLSFVSDDNELEGDSHRPVSPTHVLPHFSNARGQSSVSAEQNKIVVSPELHPPPPTSRSATPFSEIDENEVEQMFDNVIKVGKETLERQQMEERERREREERELVAKKAAEERDRKDLERMAQLVRNKGKNSENQTKKSSLKIQIKDTPHKDIPNKRRNQSDDGKYTSHIENSILRRSRTASADNNNKLNGSDSNIKRLSSSNPGVAMITNMDIDGTVVTVKRSSSSTRNSKPRVRTPTPPRPRRSYISETSSGTPIGVIHPVVAIGGGGASGRGYSNVAALTNNNLKISSISSSGITSMSDVPADLSSLTVEDVCQCLQLLNMDSHCDEFRGKQVDGKLLQDLRENVLLHEFHFTPFNASKLLRFVRGWRPNLA